MCSPASSAVPTWFGRRLELSRGAAAASEEAVIHTRVAEIAGTLTLPLGLGPVPCVILVGGTLSQTRDGGLLRERAPRRTAIKRLAHSLAASGYASFRYDKVGCGGSRATAAWGDTYVDEARALADILDYFRAALEYSDLLVAGESAGAYVACLAARAGAHADGYLFLGGFCGKAEEIFEYNYGRLFAWASQSDDRMAWARANGLDRELALGRSWPQIFEAAHKGESRYEVVDGDFRLTFGLARCTEELENPPDEMFSHIQRPAFALAGSRDLNVAPHHAARAAMIMQRAGNMEARNVLIPGADHNFQTASEHEETALRERYTFASFNRPYDARLDREIDAWLQEVSPSPDRPASSQGLYRRAIDRPELDPQTFDSPQRLHLAPGLTIIDDILEAARSVGVDTAEGRIGPLLRSGRARAHYIDMPSGMFLDEHPHAAGSLIYTVRGEWGLASLGRWHHMKAGSQYWFGDNIPTGFQTPFQNDVFILIFKAAPGDDDETFIRYLRELRGKLERQQDSGTAFRLVDLPDGHPALDFARSVNPDFDAQFRRHCTWMGALICRTTAAVLRW